jgi:lipoprotein-releasing system ATP-binding protein
MGSEEIHVLRGVELTLSRGEVVAVVGASGVGKSTLLNVLGLLDTPDRGTVTCDGEDLFSLAPAERADRRNRVFGFIFQFYHLIPELSALENVMLPSMMRRSLLEWRRSKAELRGRALEILEELGLGKRLAHRPSQLSGGERQRVAIARALVNDPDVLLCDEPTGNLDPETSVGVAEALWKLNRSMGQAMLLVTHDERMASRADRVTRMVEGRLTATAEASSD